MRIISLLPSLTELVGALGRAGDLVGVTHECDEPPEVARLPRLTRSRIPADAASGAIDAMVSDQGGSLYQLDADGLAALQPDVILTQAQCDVCAVNEADVRRVGAALPGSPHVESVNPIDLAGVWSMFRRVGDLLDARAEADRLIVTFDATAREIARRRAGRPRPRVLHLEWLDPPFTSGHWNPELIDLAGGREVLGTPGGTSRRTTWDEVAAAAPDVLLLAPCGFDLSRTEAELADDPRTLLRLRSSAPRIALADGNAYFSRPGPRLEASLRIAAAAIDPDTCGDLASAEAWRPLGVEPDSPYAMHP